MIILGIDPGLGVRSATGVALFDTKGNILEALEIWAPKNMAQHDKCHYIAQAVYEVVSVEIDLVATEGFVMRGKGGESLQRLIGAVMSRFPGVRAAYPQNTTVKKRLYGRGQASKEQVAEGVTKWFKNRKAKDAVIRVQNHVAQKQWDAIDAFAIGITAHEDLND